MALGIHFSMWIKCHSPCGARHFVQWHACCSSVSVCLICDCRVCVCRCFWVYFSPIFLFIRVCVCVCVRMCWGGLMGSVGARVLREQLSLIIQTRLIIKAAQISPWFHLNCRQAAPLRQAVVTLGRLCLFLYHYRALLYRALFCFIYCTQPNLITGTWPEASPVHVRGHCNSVKKWWKCYFFCSVWASLFAVF